MFFLLNSLLYRLGLVFVDLGWVDLPVSIENGVSVDVLMINRHYEKSSVAVPILLPRLGGKIQNNWNQ